MRRRRRPRSEVRDLPKPNNPSDLAVRRVARSHLVVRDDVRQPCDMAALRAYVRNGRVVVDEPVDLPDGTPLEVDLRPLDADNDVPPGDRNQVLRAIDEGLAAARRGEHVDAEEFVNELLSER